MPDRDAVLLGGDPLAAGSPGGQDHPRISAYALGVYQDCRRKYALRYRLNRYWPAPEGSAEDREAKRRLERGQRFHALVQAYQEDLPLDPILEAMEAEDEAIGPLWRAFLAADESRPQGRVWSEVALHFFVKGVPTMARFDRIVEESGRWTILDWKTGGNRDTLRESWQSKLYPFALAHAGQVLNDGAPIPPEAITLRYWIWKGGKGSAEGHVERLDVAYGPERYRADLAAFEEQAAIVSAPLDSEHFPGQLPSSRACRSCQYLTLCHPMRLPEPETPELPLPRFNWPQASSPLIPPSNHLPHDIPPRRGDHRGVERAYSPSEERPHD